jgi:hypothetical protein
LAATIVDLGSHSIGGLSFQHYKITADAATAVLTFPDAAAGAGPRKILGLSFPFKTTGTASAITAVYVEATGVLTIAGLTGTDVIYVTVMF